MCVFILLFFFIDHSREIISCIKTIYLVSSVFCFHLSLLKHSFLTYLFSPFLSISNFFFFTLSFHLITGLPLLIEPTISLTYIFFINSSSNHLKVFIFHPSQYTTLHSICHIFHTHFHCSHPPILSRHILLSDNSFPHHTAHS